MKVHLTTSDHQSPLMIADSDQSTTIGEETVAPATGSHTGIVVQVVQTPDG